MARPRILVADDEVDLIAELKPLLERSGYDVSTAIDGRQALERVREIHPDLIILDVLMPYVDGREVLRRLREADDWTPVILLTQVGTPTERAMSLQEGADDYINKPFDPFELLARVQAVLRRTQQGRLPISSYRWLIADDLRVDRQGRHVWLSDEQLNLTARALGVLEYLMLHPGETVPRERLLDEVWGWSYAVETRAVDIRIAELRKALGDDADEPRFVETVVGQGYRFLIAVEGKQ
ncbi:MAG: response regulator transcription factor [Anaerolineae bacterium]|nr:response regulator transcription factor [Anaerolineae bacterium]